MVIFSVYVVNKAGGLIYQLDSYAPRAQAEKTFSYLLDLLLKLHDERVQVAFGQWDSIRVGHAVLAISGMGVKGQAHVRRERDSGGSSGIKMLETDTFKMHCHQTLIGIKFVVQIIGKLEEILFSERFMRLTQTLPSRIHSTP
ncbi:Trafficking protein particle complex subunit 4 [Plecturocebus cupreus]